MIFDDQQSYRKQIKLSDGTDGQQEKTSFQHMKMRTYTELEFELFKPFLINSDTFGRVDDSSFLMIQQ